MLNDIKQAIRMLARAPGLTATAVLVMAIGIGGNASVFSVIHAVLEAGLPFRHPSDTVLVYGADARKRGERWLSYPDYLDVRSRSELFTAVAAVGDGDFVSLVEHGRTETLLGEPFSASLFDVLQIAPSVGRAFRPEEDEPGSPLVAVLSHAVWVRRFGSDPSVVGRVIRLNGHAVTVVGVGPPGFRGTLGVIDTEVWVPWGTAAVIDGADVALDRRGGELARVFAVRRPGVSYEQAVAALDTLGQTLAHDFPESHRDLKLSVFRASQVALEPTVDKLLAWVSGFLLVVVGLVLLVTCSNLAGLLLVRGLARQREIGIRLALGATRARVVRALLTETAVLGLLGGVAGVAVAAWIGRALVSFRPPLPVAITLPFDIDGTVVAYALALAVVTSVIVALVPVLRVTRLDIAQVVKLGVGPGRLGARRLSLRHGIVVVQIAVSCVLLVGAGVSAHGLLNGLAAGYGFDAAHTALAVVDPSLAGYGEAAVEPLLDRIETRVASIPGVTAVALANRAPFGLWGLNRTAVQVAGATGDLQPGVDIDYAIVSHAYFDVLGLPIRAGRGFLPADRHPDTGAGVAIVSSTMASRFWGSDGPVGASFVMGSGARRRVVRVVGVAADAPGVRRREPGPFFYLPFPGGPRAVTVVLARAGGSPDGLPALLRREIAAIDPGLPVLDAATMETRAGVVHYVPRLLSSLLSGFGLVAMLVALVGLYGLVAFSVARRLKELAIRAALGAAPRHILGSVLGEVIAMTAVGLGIGLPLGSLATRPLQRLLDGVSWFDPLTLAAVTVFVSAATVGAALWPARGAVSAGAMRALREP